MTISYIAVIDQLVTLIKANPNFDSLAAIYKGEQYKVPLHHYPLCEIVWGASEDVTQSTGFQDYNLRGFTRFSVRMADNAALTDRVAVSDSYETVVTYIDAFKALVADNPSLGGITFTSTGIVQRFQLDSPIELGVTDRTNNYENVGQVPWICSITEPRD